jgi:hypothetical protein
MSSPVKAQFEVIKRLQSLDSRVKAVEKRPTQNILNGQFNNIAKASVVDDSLIIETVDGKKYNAGYVRGKVGVAVNGVDGNDGKDGNDGVDGKDGLNGKDGLPGKRGLPGKDGEDGVDGEVGCGIVDIEISRQGDVIVEMSDGRKVKSGRIHFNLGGGFVYSAGFGIDINGNVISLDIDSVTDYTNDFLLMGG